MRSRSVSMRRFAMVVVMPLLAVSTKGAESEGAQHIKYLQCVAAREGDSGRLTNEINAACVAEAGFEVPSEAIRTAAIAAFRSCITLGAVELDDNISPASDIARAVLRRCSGEWRASVDALVMPPSYKRKMISGIEQYALDDAMQTVLVARRRTKEVKEGAKPPPQKTR